MDAITVTGLVKTYRDRRVVDGVDLRLAPGQTLALLGPNGAGKTTTVEILTGHRRRDRGTVQVLGADPDTAGPDWRARIGVVAQHHGVFDLLTPREALAHLATLYPDPLTPTEAMRRLDIESLADARIGRLSGGQARRVDVACGIIGRPEVLFLDEPTTGLDPAARRGLWELVDDLADAGTAVLLTTHHLEEVEALADHVVVIDHGRVVATGTPESLGPRGGADVEVSFEDSLGPLPATLLVADASIERRAGRVVVTTTKPTELVTRLSRWLDSSGAGRELPDLRIRTLSLEDSYLALLGPENHTEEVAA